MRWTNAFWGAAAVGLVASVLALLTPLAGTAFTSWRVASWGMKLWNLGGSGRFLPERHAPGGLTCQKYGKGTSRVVGTSGAAYCAISLNGQGLVGVKSAATNTASNTPACEVNGRLYTDFDCCCNA